MAELKEGSCKVIYSRRHIIPCQKEIIIEFLGASYTSFADKTPPWEHFGIMTAVLQNTHVHLRTDVPNCLGVC